MSTIKQAESKTYIDERLDINKGDEFVNDIKPLAKKTIERL